MCACVLGTRKLIEKNVDLQNALLERKVEETKCELLDTTYSQQVCVCVCKKQPTQLSSRRAEVQQTCYQLVVLFTYLREVNALLPA